VPLEYRSLALFTGPFNDVPEEAVAGVLDLGGHTGVFRATGNGTFFFARLVRARKGGRGARQDKQQLLPACMHVCAWCWVQATLV
jgi:hypothetical protein